MRPADVPVVRCRGAGRTYGRGPAATVALQPTDCDVRAGDRIALLGPSGSGKSSLLHLMAGLDYPTLGEVTWPAFGDAAALRPGPVALVLHGPSLLPPLTMLENVALPLILGGQRAGAARRRAHEALDRLGLGEAAEQLPEEVSGGQAQRVAVARALAAEARLVLADEPTGQLDRENADAVAGLLLAASQETGAALVVATHDPAVAGRLGETWTMQSGALRTDPEPAAAWPR
jgi:predicted ABC-type transport system involved in lysophospholipase L1 biosynthesis ATPase subunit